MIRQHVCGQELQGDSLTAIVSGFPQLGTWCHGSAVFSCVVWGDQAGVADWMLSSVQLHLLDEIIYTSILMLPATIKPYHIHGGDLGTCGTCRNEIADLLSVHFQVSSKPCCRSQLQ